MSRFGEYDGDENFNNEGYFWEKRAELALRGRRGRAALQDLRDALLALPEKRLISRALCTVGGVERVRPEIEKTYPIENWRQVPEELARRAEYVERDLSEYERLLEEQGQGVCAIGAYVWWQKVKAGATAEEAFDALPTIADTGGGGDSETANAGKAAGLTYTLAWELASKNDDEWHRTPEERYDRFLAWIDEELARPPLKKPEPRVRRRRAAATPPAPVATGQLSVGL